MDSPTNKPQKAALADYLAAERTLLAWIRTGLALMGFGFVVARFGLFLQQIQLVERGQTAHNGGPVLSAHGITAVTNSTARIKLTVAGFLDLSRSPARREEQKHSTKAQSLE